MTFFQLGLIFLTVFALSFGQILFKMSATDLDFSFPGLFFNALNTKLIFALFVYFISTVMWLFVLKNTPLRTAYPFAAFAFILVPLLSNALLREPIAWNTFVGAGFIAIGVWISVYK